MKKPRLFLWCEAEDCWTPINKDGLWSWVEADLDASEHGEKFELQFKREDMTDEEFEAIPEG